VIGFFKWDAATYSKSCKSFLVILVMFSAPLGGCFGNSSQFPDSSNLEISNDLLFSGEFQAVGLSTDLDLSVFIPYLILNPETGFIQNSTIVDLKSNEDVVLQILVPPRVDNLVLMVGEWGRDNWPIRGFSESWFSWELRGGESGGESQGAVRIVDENGTYNTVKVLEGIYPDSVSLKWISSTMLLAAMMFRAEGMFQLADLTLSFLGCMGWLWVGLLWKDRALIILNAVAVVILGGGLLRYLVPVLIA